MPYIQHSVQHDANKEHDYRAGSHEDGVAKQCGVVVVGHERVLEGVGEVEEAERCVHIQHRAQQEVAKRVARHLQHAQALKKTLSVQLQFSWMAHPLTDSTAGRTLPDRCCPPKAHPIWRGLKGLME